MHGTGKVLGDVDVVTKGKIGKRAGRIAGKVAGKILRKLFK